MTTLLVMLFYRSRNIFSYFSRQYGKQIEKEGSKNPYYDMLGNEDVPWRIILYLFAKRYLSLMSRVVDHNKQKIRALIFDDSPLEKTGWRMEGVSKIHDHVTGRYILGFKLLVSGYWDGNSFIPIDFSLHREQRTHHLEKRAVLNSLKEEEGADPRRVQCWNMRSRRNGYRVPRRSSRDCGSR